MQPGRGRKPESSEKSTTVLTHTLRQLAESLLGGILIGLKFVFKGTTVKCENLEHNVYILDFLNCRLPLKTLLDSVKY